LAPRHLDLARAVVGLQAWSRYNRADLICGTASGAVKAGLRGWRSPFTQAHIWHRCTWLGDKHGQGLCGF